MARLSAWKGLMWALAVTAAGRAWAAEPDGSAQPQAAFAAFGPGEQATYRVEFLGMVAGKAQVTVGSEMKHWGTDVFPIVSVATSDPKMSFYPIRDRFVTYWDPATQRSIGSELFADEGGKRRHQRIKLDHAAGSATVTKQKDGAAPSESTVQIQAGTADVAAATFLMRSRRLVDGAEFDVPIFTGAKSFLLHAKVEGRTTLKTALGDREVFKIRTQTDFSGKFESKRDMYAYLTTDETHLPVRIEAEFLLGRVVADLVEFHEGRRLAKR